MSRKTAVPNGTAAESFIFEDFLGDINGTAFGLLESSADIFADDANAEKLEGTKKEDQNYNGGIAGHINSPKQLFDNNPNKVEDGNDSGDTTKIGRQPQGSGGIADNAFNSIIEKLEKVPFCSSVKALAGGVGDIAGIVTDPGENAFGEAVVFGKLKDAVPHAAAECAEIAGIGLKRYAGKKIDDGIEPLFEETQHTSFQRHTRTGSTTQRSNQSTSG